MSRRQTELKTDNTGHRGLGPEHVNSVARLSAVLQGKRPDRVPVAAFVSGYAANLFGMSLKDFYTSGADCLRVQLDARRRHGYDDMPTHGWVDWGGWEFGGSIHIPDSYLECAPRTSVHPVNTPSDLDRLSVPDPRRAGMFPDYMEFNRRSREMGLSVKIRSGSVTSVVGSMLGLENLMRWLVKEPEAVKDAYRKAADFILAAADMMIGEFGADACQAFISAPLDCNNLMSPKLFGRFAAPVQKHVIESLRARGIKNFFVHLCGDHKLNLPIWNEIGLPDRSVMSIGEMDLVQVAEAFNHRQVLGGNVSTSVLAMGTAQEVFEQAKKCIQEAKDLPGGFILMPACSMPVLTPPANVDAMISAAREYGRY
jgi:uroporphyrinogen decarboxylase